MSQARDAGQKGRGVLEHARPRFRSGSMTAYNSAGPEDSGPTNETCVDCAALTDGLPCSHCYISGRKGFSCPEDADSDTPTDSAGPELRECTVCGAVGLPKRIRDHDCQQYIEWMGV